jgi:hypothetical protein
VKREDHGFAIVGLALAACALVGGVVVALITLGQGPGEPGWTGVAITVPSCPADAHGCRVFVIRASIGSNSVNGPDIARKDWSGAATTLNIVLPPGTYAISAEGCAGYKIENTLISLTSGFNRAIVLDTNWEMPEFLGRVCPGFGSLPVHTSHPGAG